MNNENINIFLIRNKFSNNSGKEVPSIWKIVFMEFWHQMTFQKISPKVEERFFTTVQVFIFWKKNSRFFLFTETFKLVNNQFLNNWASIDGGAISYKSGRPLDINNYFLNNSARNYGNKISSYATRMQFFSENGSFSDIKKKKKY